MAESLKLKWPATCKVITQNYGNKNSRYAKGYHTGIDIGCLAGTPIYAAHDGTVSFSGWNGSYGNEVRIDYNNSFQTSYHHMSRTAVNKGDVVSAGRTIGFIGSTGQSTGPHLHFEVRRNGTDIDPAPFLDGAQPLPGEASQAGLLPNPVDGVTQILEILAATSGVFRWLSDTKNHFRIALIIAGSLLILIAVVGAGKAAALGKAASVKLKSVSKTPPQKGTSDAGSA